VRTLCCCRSLLPHLLYRYCVRPLKQEYAVHHGASVQSNDDCGCAWLDVVIGVAAGARGAMALSATAALAVATFAAAVML